MRRRQASLPMKGFEFLGREPVARRSATSRIDDVEVRHRRGKSGKQGDERPLTFPSAPVLLREAAFELQQGGGERG